MTVIVFATKTEVFDFLDELQNYGLCGRIVSIPKKLRMGCGLAVGVNDNLFTAARIILKRGDYPTFRGIYKVYDNGRKILKLL